MPAWLGVTLITIAAVAANTVTCMVGTFEL